MSNRCLLCYSLITVASIIVLYIAYSRASLDGNSSRYQVIINAFSQKTISNKSYQETVGWLFSNRNEENITLQGYALGWDFYEAQTCAARNLLGLQHWATSLDYGVVEPFVFESYFRASQFSNDEALRLSDYFDIDVWNHKVMTTIPGGTPLVRWEDFIKKAARQLIVVHIMIRSSEGTKVYVDDDVHKRTCYSARGFTKSTFSKFGFTVVRQVCFKFFVRSPLSISEFNKNILGPYKANNVSIVFTFVPGVNRARINILEERYHHKFVDWLKPSKRVINDAKKYIDMFLDTSYVAVSMRTVKMAISLRPRHPTDIKEATKIAVSKCMEKIGQIFLNVSGQHFMTIDIGRFGDPNAKSFMTSTTVKEILNKMINLTYNNSWNPEEWENTFIKVTNGISDSGYIASVQKEIVSHATTVIVAGGGSFQSSMLLQHKSQSTQKHDVLQPCS